MHYSNKNKARDKMFMTHWKVSLPFRLCSLLLLTSETPREILYGSFTKKI